MPDRGLTRRGVLLTGVAATGIATAGCLDSLQVSRGDQRTLHLSLSRTDSPLREQYVVDLAETPSERDEAAFQAVMSGSTYTSQYRTPFASTPEDPAFAEHDGTYYRLGSVIVDEATEIRPVLRLHDADDASASAVDQLPEGDRDAVHLANMAARARGNAGGVPWGLIQRGGYVYRDDDRIDASRILSADGPEYITYRDRQYAISVTRELFHEPVYRATAEPVATSPAQMETVLRATVVDSRIDRESLSREAQDVLREARREGYSEPHPYSAAYRAVIRAIDKRAYLDGDIQRDAFSDGRAKYGRGILLYDAGYYRYQLRFRSPPDT